MINKIIFLLFLLLLLFSCAKRPTYQDPIPQHETFTIDSKKVNETRVINVWFPPNYKENGIALPVLYMPDGGIVNEDFPHVANTLAELIANQEIEPMILVGIQNTNRRRDLTGFSENFADSIYCPLSDGAKDFRAFITEELMPEIKARYLITNKKSILGESLAGLFVMETFFLQPDAFDCYIAFDPSLWWNNQHLVKTAEAQMSKLPAKKMKLWFAGSDAKDISEHTRELVNVLQHTAPKNLIWKYSDQPKEQHHTIFRATKIEALKWTFGEHQD